jgi:hypothetical protein
MKPVTLHLGNFATRINELKFEFLGNPMPDNPSHWLAYYEGKIAAYDLLCRKVPQIKEISDFWRLVQNSSGNEWLPWVQKEIARIVSSAKCSECGTKVAWPKKICLGCLKERRESAKRARLLLRTAPKSSMKKISTKRPKIKKTILRAS